MFVVGRREHSEIAIAGIVSILIPFRGQSYAMKILVIENDPEGRDVLVPRLD